MRQALVTPRGLHTTSTPGLAQATSRAIPVASLPTVRRRAAPRCNRSGSEEQRGGITLRNGLRVPGLVPISDPAATPCTGWAPHLHATNPQHRVRLVLVRANAKYPVEVRDFAGRAGETRSCWRSLVMVGWPCRGLEVGVCEGGVDCS
jgi:hypothetical protein